MSQKKFTLCFEKRDGHGYSYDSLEMSEVSSPEDLLRKAEARCPKGMRLTKIILQGGMLASQHIWYAIDGCWIDDVVAEAFPTS